MTTIARNTFFLSASQITARTIGFFYFVFLARRLGVENFGIYIFTLAFVYNFFPVADFGLERLILRDISRNLSKIQFYFARLLPLRFFLALVTYFLVLVIGATLGQSPRQLWYLAIFGLGLIPYSLIYLIIALQNAREKMEYMAVTSVILNALAITFGSLFVLFGFSLAWVLLAYFLAHFLVLSFFLLRLSSLDLKLEWIIDQKFWRKVFFESWCFAALLILAVFYLRLSLVAVGLLKGAYGAGIYGSAFKFIEAGILIPQSLALALFPLSSRLFADNKNKLRNIYKKNIIILFLGGLALGAAMFFGSNFIIPLVYGHQYSQAVPVFSILGISMILFFANALPGNIIQNSPRVKQFLPWAFLNFLIAGILCLVLIPKYSILGAAWAVVGGEAAGLFINNLFVWRILKE